MNGPDRGGGQEELDELPGVTVDEAEVGAAPAQGPGVGEAEVLRRLLHPDVVHLGVTQGGVEEEAPLADPELELDGTGIAELSRQVENGILAGLLVETDEE